MSGPKHSILPVEAADLPTLTKLFYELVLAQPTNRFSYYNWPAEALQISRYTTLMEKAFKNPNTEMFKAIDNISGEIIAVLILVRRRPGETNWSPPEISDLPDEMNKEFGACMKQVMETAEGDIKDIDHYFLDSIFVKSTNRVHGIGSQLVELCIEKARDAKVPLFLTSVPTAHGFYLKLGFQDTTYGDVDLSEWTAEYGGFGVYRLFGMLLTD